MREAGAAAWVDRRCGEAVGGDAEGDVEAADEGGRRELEHRSRETAFTLLARTLDDLLGLRRSHALQVRQDLLGVEAEERILVAADLVHVNVVEARLLELADLLEVRRGVRPADDRLRDLVGRDEFSRGFVVLWGGELLA